MCYQILHVNFGNFTKDKVNIKITIWPCYLFLFVVKIRVDAVSYQLLSLVLEQDINANCNLTNLIQQLFVPLFENRQHFSSKSSLARQFKFIQWNFADCRGQCSLFQGLQITALHEITNFGVMNISFWHCLYVLRCHF